MIVEALPYELETPEETLARTNDSRVIVAPKPFELFIDIDNGDDLELFDMMCAILTRNYVHTDTPRITPSQEEGHYHVVVSLDRPVDNMTRIALQACLGSDRKRELLSIIRALNGDTRPTVFFEEVADGKDSE